MEVAASYKATAFTCPHCGVCAAQLWGQASLTPEAGAGPVPVEGWELTKCANCGGVTVWREGKLVMPTPLLGSPVNPDLPAPVLAAYNEARALAALSPRSACALLRSIINRIAMPPDARHQYPTLTRRIQRLGLDRLLPPHTQEALYRLRVIGPDAASPGSLDSRDDDATARELLEITAMMADHVISTPKRMSATLTRLAADAAQKAAAEATAVQATAVDGEQS